MADYLVLQKYSGYIEGHNYRYTPGTIVSDLTDPVAALIAQGCAMVAYVPATMAAAVAAFLEAQGSDPDQTMESVLSAFGALPGVGLHASSHLPGAADALTTAAAGTIAVGDAGAEGVAASFARSDHQHAVTAPAAPAAVDKSAADPGAAVTVARSDHKHDVTTGAPGSIQPDAVIAEGTAASLARSDHTHGIVAATPGAIQVGDAAAEGAATSFARSDHVHSLAAPAAPVDVTKAAANAGAAAAAARADHKHDVSTAAAGAIQIGDSGAEGAATSLARSDHTHALAAPAAPADVTKAAAAAGAATAAARADHKHDVSTAAPVDIGGANAEGAATSLARSNHVHKLAQVARFAAHEGTPNGSGNAAAAGTRNGHRTYDFDDGSVVADEQIVFEGLVPEHYTGGDLDVVLHWVAAAAVAGDVVWDVAFERMEAGVLDIDADGYAADQSVTRTAPGTAGIIDQGSVTLTQAEADGITAGDAFRVKVKRDTTDVADTLVGDAQLLRVDITQ